jgi:hypothetical protein
MEVPDGSYECLTLRTCKSDDGIRTLPNTLQGQDLLPITMVFLPNFTSHLTSYLSLRRLPICQYVGGAILEALHFVCVWIACGMALVTCACYDGTSSGPVNVVLVLVLPNLIATIARRA